MSPTFDSEVDEDIKMANLNNNNIGFPNLSQNHSSSSKIIYLTRHGESENNLKGKIGGDTDLSTRGKKYADNLANHINSLELKNLQLWTSTYKRTIRTAAGIKNVTNRQMFADLDELYAGICEGLSYEEIANLYPREFAMRDFDKLKYRYPKGESYEDLMNRVMRVIKKIDNNLNETSNLLIVSHQAVLRCILTHFLKKPLCDLPYIQVPLHTLIFLTNEDSEWKLNAIKLSTECVDTYRPKPRNADIESILKGSLIN